MVYCQKCGTKNVDNADYCEKCGANLQTGTHVSRRHDRKKAEEDCFGLPNGGAIGGIVLGILLLLWGSTLFLDIQFNFWYLILIILGILMVAGALYKITRPKSP